MTGVKGKSGGPRKNSGGARPGAGRKPKEKPAESANLQPSTAPECQTPDMADSPELDMLEMLQAVALGKVKATPVQVRAAIAAVQYTHTKRGDGGKKDEAAARAKNAAASGRFKSGRAPLLWLTKKTG
ncbi:MAG: hypothetical protein AB7I35_12870 [Ramlibacter sp.]